MKRTLTIISIVLFLFFLFRLTYSYRIFPFPNAGDKKHKVYGVFYFPQPSFVFINPLKKKKLRTKIVNYAASDKYAIQTDSLFSSYSKDIINYFSAYKDEISKGDFKIISIKYEEPYYHLLLCRINNPESTIVFKLDSSTDEIQSHY